MPILKKMRWLCLAGLVLLWAFIFGNSLTPAAQSTQQSTQLLGQLQHLLAGWGDGWLPSEHLLRKAAHFAEFAALGGWLFVTAAAFSLPWRRYSGWLLLAGLLSALADESIQLFVPGRSGQVSDVWLDFAGICFGGLCAVAGAWLWPRLRRARPGGSAPPPA